MEELERKVDMCIRKRGGDAENVRRELALFIQREEDIEAWSLEVMTLLRAYIYDKIFLRGDISLDL
jgi:hypothetical protein